MTFNIETKDLNAIDALNAKAQTDSKYGINPVKLDSQELKGSLNKYNQGLNNKFNLNQEFNFISTIRQQILEFQISQFEYSGLPEGLNKLRIEQKLIENGQCVIVEILGSFFICNFTQNDYNIYGEPTKVTIVEPKSKILNGKKLTIGINCGLLRSTINGFATFTKVWRFLNSLEKTLFQIEKNLLSAAPKGILNPKKGIIDSPTDHTLKNSWEIAINGEDTFYVIRTNELDGNLTDGLNKEEFFIPIELKDRTAELIANYSFFKENIKEMIGAPINLINGKKERLITDEVESQQSLNDQALKHMLEIRQNDLENINKLYNINIQVALPEAAASESESENKEE